MPLIVTEDGVEVAQRVVIHMLGDPVTHRAVESCELPVVLLTAAASSRDRGQAGGGAVGHDVTTI